MNEKEFLQNTIRRYQDELDKRMVDAEKVLQNRNKTMDVNEMLRIASLLNSYAVEIEGLQNKIEAYKNAFEILTK